MHLLWEANWKYVLTIPAAMMSVYLVLMLVPDVGLRMRKYAEERKVFAAEPMLHEAHVGHSDSHSGSHDGSSHDAGSDSVETH